LDFITLTNRLGEMAQTWEQLLHLSGGALNLKKCAYHILVWEWKAGRPVLRTIHDDDPALRLYQGTNRAVEQIRRTDPTSASRILGVHISPVGDFLSQIQVLKEKCEPFALLLKLPKLIK
jgi:hypothetical protein